MQSWGQKTFFHLNKRDTLKYLNLLFPSARSSRKQNKRGWIPAPPPRGISFLARNICLKAQYKVVNQKSDENPKPLNYQWRHKLFPDPNVKGLYSTQYLSSEIPDEHTYTAVGGVNTSRGTSTLPLQIPINSAICNCMEFKGACKKPDSENIHGHVAWSWALHVPKLGSSCTHTFWLSVGMFRHRKIWLSPLRQIPALTLSGIQP